MTEIQKFDFQGHFVRTVQIEGVVWWVLRDVCKVLGLSNSRVVSDRLGEDEVSQAYITDTLNRQQQTTIVNESGLYAVLLRSDKPQAVPFRKWVTSEVLPTIRKTGSYSIHQPQHVIDMSDPFVVAQLYVESEADRRRLEKENKLAHQEIELARPKVEAFESLINADGMCLLRDVCKIIKNNRLGQNKMYEFLRERGHIMKHSTKPYQRHVEAGLYVLKAVTFTVGGKEKFDSVTYVTPKGIEAIRQLLIEADESLGTPILDLEWMEA